MYIYIEGKEPVSRKSKSLAEMGVNDGDNLIVTTEMKLPFDEISDSDNEAAGYDVNGTMFPNPANNKVYANEIDHYGADPKASKPIDINADKPGLQTPPNFTGQVGLVNQNNQYDPAIQGQFNNGMRNLNNPPLSDGDKTNQRKENDQHNKNEVNKMINNQNQKPQ